MTRVSLDSNAVIAFVKDPKASPIAERVRQHGLDKIVISAIVLQELLYGVERSDARFRAGNLLRLRQLTFAIQDFDRGDAAMTGRVRALLAASGKNIGPYDSMIAGQALARGMTVITNNLREFGRVPGLICADWTLPSP